MQPAAELLDRPWCAESFRREATRTLRAALEHGQTIALYGAGQTGRLVARLLGDAASCFLDDTPGKQGQTIEGLPVHPLEAGMRALAARPLIVVCIFSAGHSFAATRARLQAMHGCDVCSFAEVLHATGFGLPNLYLGSIDHQVAQQARYRSLRERLADDRSRTALDRHLRARLLADMPAEADDRCDLGFLDLPAGTAPTFVDGGAFDGDTLADFLAWRGDDYARIVAFEPDARNFSRLRERVAALAPHHQRRIELRQAALWSSRGRMAFDATGQVGSALNAHGAESVETDTLECLAALPGPLLVKLDVEGAEEAVLTSGLRWIRERRPTLAISVYHRPGDLLDLFELVDRQGLGYRYFLRCHGGDGSDLTLYCTA